MGRGIFSIARDCKRVAASAAWSGAVVKPQDLGLHSLLVVSALPFRVKPPRRASIHSKIRSATSGRRRLNAGLTLASNEHLIAQEVNCWSSVQQRGLAYLRLVSTSLDDQNALAVVLTGRVIKHVDTAST